MHDSRKATCSSAVTFDMVCSAVLVGFDRLVGRGVVGGCLGDGCRWRGDMWDG